MTQVGVDIDCAQGWRGAGLAEALSALRPGAALVVSLTGPPILLRAVLLPAIWPGANLLRAIWR